MVDRACRSLFVAHRDPDAVEELVLTGVPGSAQRSRCPALGAFPRLRALELWGFELDALHVTPAAALRALALHGDARLASLTGIGAWPLEQLTLGELPALELADACATIAGELPALELLELDCGGRGQLPASLAAVGVRELRLLIDDRFALSPALAIVARMPRLARLRLSRCDRADDDEPPTVALPDGFAALGHVELLSIQLAVAQAPPSLAAMPALRELDLSSNRLGDLPAALATAPALEVLDLRYNPQLAALPELGALRRLRALHLYGTGIRALPASIVELTELRELDVPDGVGEPPPGFEALRFDAAIVPRAWAVRPTMRALDEARAEHLRLPRPGDDHAQRRLPDDLGDPRTLYIGSDARGPAAAFGRLTRLEALDLVTSSSLVNDVLARLGRIPTLRRLELLHHEPLPAAIGYARSLHSLIARGLRAVPRELGALAELRTLILSGTFDKLPDLGGLVQLRSLELHADCLRSLEPSIGRLPALEELAVSASLSALPATLASAARLRRVAVVNAHQLRDATVLARIPGLRELRVRCCRELAWEPLLRALAGGPLTKLVADFADRGAPAALGALELDELVIVDAQGEPPDLSRMTRLGRLTLAEPMLARMTAMPPGTWLVAERDECDDDGASDPPIVTLEREGAVTP